MAVRITFPDSSTEVLPKAKGAKENDIDDAYDFYDDKGNMVGIIPCPR